MRAILVLLAAAAIAACGKSAAPPTSQSNGPPAVQYVLAVSTQGDGLVRGLGSDCRGSCTQRFDTGTQITLHAVPDSGATFSGWGGACSGTADCVLTVSSDLSVTAAFARGQVQRRQLTVLVDGHGSVRSSPAGIDCGNTCSAMFDQGTSIALTSTADAGWSFTGWSGGCSGAAGCSVTLAADTVVRAKFDAIPPPPPPPMVTLTVSVDGQGSVSGSGIACPGTCSAQVAAGSSVTLTAQAASGARFMGFAGACSGATCTFTIASDASVSARFEDEVMTLAPADGTNNTSVLGLNSSSVFFQRYGSGIYGIWSVPKAGGAETLVASYCCATYVVADDDFVYWSDYSGIVRAPAGGGAVQRLYSSYAGIPTLVLDGQELYWVTYQDYYSSGGVFTMPAAGGTATKLAAGNPTGGIAVDSQDAYWTDNSHSIMRVPKAGGAVDTPISCGGCVPMVVRLDFDNIYYRNNDSDTWSRAKSGGDFHLLSSLTPRSSSAFNIGLDVNASVAYYNFDDGSATPQGLYSANADGTGAAAIETSADSNWSPPRVDDNYIFYFHAGALYRRLK